MENNNVQYKWTKLLAAKRFNSDNGDVMLTPLEQQELLDDISMLRGVDTEEFENTCDNCDGTGYSGYDRSYPPNPYICEYCNGTGEITKHEIK